MSQTANSFEQQKSDAIGEREKRDGKRDANWPNWYATYMAAEQTRTELAK
jgi:hypothetical protein